MARQKYRRQHGDGWSFRPAHEEAAPAPTVSLPPEEQRFVVELDRRKKGKVVTVVNGLVLDAGDLKALGKALKSACGTGGTAKGGVIELQGDCRERAAKWLEENGWGRP